MPLQDAKSEANYVKVTRLYVSSADRIATSASRYDYHVVLPEQLQYVVGFEVTGYSFPTSIAPTFVPRSGASPGTDRLDFSLTAGATTTVFSAAWPHNQYTYQNNAVPYLSYVDVLQQLLNDAIKGDATFGVGAPNAAQFASSPDASLHTNLSVSGAGVTGFRLLFASGPNAADSAYLPMGFNKADTALALSVQSPGLTQLQPFRFIDISLEEAAEFRPLKRIYITDQQSYGSVRNDLDITRTRLLSSRPIRTLQRLHVYITLENGAVPPDTGVDHDFTLTTFSVSNEISLPKWLNQTFVL